MLFAESIVHTCDPFALQFTETFGIRWYGLAYAAAFLAGWLLFRWFAKTGRTPLTTAQVGDYATMLVLGVLVGGRVGHVLFYEPTLLTTFTGTFPFWGLLELQRGGMSSHGGIAGIAIVSYFFARKHGVSLLHLGDLACFVAPIGLGLGRLANWVNGELWGKPLPDAVQAAPPWWSVKFPEEMLTMGFARVSELAKLAPQRTALNLEPDQPIAEALFKACYEGNAVVIAKVAPLLTARYPINFMQAFTDGVVLMTILVIAWLRPRPAGWIFGWFFLAYGVLRIVTEQYRIPDPDILTIGPITLPMLLSALMSLIGASTLVIVSRHPDRRGGLLRRSEN
ncbi:MAG: prolipoprotein diacylglyceryl transferase [Phycisphaerae bacterium]|nr:prolipoprotein diacylglyceryl transferase [Phycisphaerae bacterium]